jgi:uncharacterized membrane protein
MELMPSLVHFSTLILETLGVSIIVLVALKATFNAIQQLQGKRQTASVFITYRHQLAHGILIGLELLVGADIISTVTINLSYTNVGKLAAVVLIRTFLSFTLEVETTGSWPWQKPHLTEEAAPLHHERNKQSSS